ncbi:hypothetical protein [Paenibacillus qinlingensis]|uniref:hypothetical protein n=1 Tax=Paenibacillus qinlingensis TaxID=1837343 RepID=UPI001563E3E5|nr:hypothetical protein [Paenibacillus qinlingensis]NQX61715.1 hypothetical protein [Paenibacillus qinlingensis]
MKKRRSTVLVSPGKDVTLYIPTETPPEVIAYMNQLKAEGMFSHGIMEILTTHILREQSLATLVGEENPNHAIESFVEDDHFFTAPIEHQESVDIPVSNRQKNFSLEDIFRQAGRNAGKLM